jgi:uncharacterized protein (DUF433 family)
VVQLDEDPHFVRVFENRKRYRESVCSDCTEFDQPRHNRLATHSRLCRIPVCPTRITVDPEICHGKPCIRGLRYPVETILKYLAGGDTIEDLLKEFPDLEREDILACHEFARRMLTAKTLHLPLT